MDHRGWLDTGQHFTISRGGVRPGGAAPQPRGAARRAPQVEGAHCTGQNVVAVGIENEGTYTAIEPPAALWLQLRELCAYICVQYGIPPTEIYGHRDFKDTACPGDSLYGMLPRLRAEVARALGQSTERGPAGDLAAAARWPTRARRCARPSTCCGRRVHRGPGARPVRPGHRGRGAGLPAPSGRVEVTGMIGGESWPLLVRPVRAGQGGEAGQAVRLLAARHTGRDGAPPTTVDQASWQALLPTGRMAADLRGALDDLPRNPRWVCRRDRTKQYASDRPPRSGEGGVYAHHDPRRGVRPSSGA